MTFKQALRRLPWCVQGSYDALYHTRIDQLAFITQHELDLYFEGEVNDIRNQKDLAKAKAYFLALTGKEYRHDD